MQLQQVASSKPGSFDAIIDSEITEDSKITDSRGGRMRPPLRDILREGASPSLLEIRKKNTGVLGVSGFFEYVKDGV